MGFPLDLWAHSALDSGKGTGVSGTVRLDRSWSQSMCEEPVRAQSTVQGCVTESWSLGVQDPAVACGWSAACNDMERLHALLRMCLVGTAPGLEVAAASAGAPYCLCRTAIA